jgi:hypothetical protein
MKTKDGIRKWMWWALAALAAVQLYAVRELLAALALFSVAFAAIAFMIFSVYMIQKGWELAVSRAVASGHPIVSMARNGVSAVEDMARRPLRRPRSEPAR